ncbi:MAG TPA: glycosyltransferase family 39 protein [Candidatus Bathyarchaeia archaeon]|nr:glycosyltransferase family 39 protein [Candidatus Bathyarchaeia archaeon]
MRSFGRPLAAALAFSAAVVALKLLVALYPTQGLLRSDLYPLWMRWERGGAGAWLIAAAAVPALLAIPRVRRAPLPVLIPLVAGVWIAFASSNGGLPAGLTAPFERDEDYIHDVGKITLSTWVDRQPDLSLHARTHPPGAVLLMSALGGSPLPVALGMILLSALTILPLHAWARESLDETGARYAVLLWTSIPATLLYGATCMDMVFALPLVTAGWLLLGKRGETTAGAIAGGVALAIGAMFTFSAAVLAIAVGISAIGTRKLRGPAIAAATCIAVLLLTRLTTGFDWLASMRLAAKLDAAEWPAWSSLGYYLVTRLMGILDFLILAGVALAPFWIGSLRGSSRAGIASRSVALAALLVLIFGAYKIGETGRILVFLYPIVVLRVVEWLDGDDGAILGTALLGFAQALLFEAVLDTRW